MSERPIYDFGLVSSFYAKPEMQGFSLVPPGWSSSTPFFILQSHVAPKWEDSQLLYWAEDCSAGDGTELRNSAETINFYRSLESSCGIEWNCSGPLHGDQTPLNIASAEYFWR